MEAEIVVKPAAGSLSVSMSSASASASAWPAAGGGGGEEFTADDLAAADQLVQLSVSGGGDEEDHHHHQEACSSSARSVNNAVDEGARRYEEDSGSVDRRARKRYRLVSELYAATRQARAGAGKSKRRSSRDGMRN